MASGDNEHRMLFDLRGRRRNVVKVVYATLAVLMGLSLFLVIGGFNIAELFNDSESAGDAAKPYEEQAERIERKLKKDPQDPDLLIALTRAQVGAGRAQVEVDPNGSQTFTADAVQEYQKAYNSWSEYLKAVDKPEVGVALLMAPTLLQLAELSRSYEEASSRIQAASDAQRIVAEQRPSLNAWSTLAFYTYFTGDFAAAEKARAEAEKLAGEKAEREALGKQLDGYEKSARTFLKEKAKAEQAQKASGGGEGSAPESLENPLNPLAPSGSLGE
jgi:hypothetical protein